MAVPTNEFLKFCTRVLTDITEDGGYSRLELWHAVENEPASCLDTVHLSSDQELEAEDLAQSLVNVAQSDCETRESGYQRYTVLAFRPEAQSHECQCAFRLHHQEHAQFKSRMGDQSDPPTEKGVIAQGQRHMENVFRLHMEASASTINMLTKRNQLLEESTNRMLENQIKVFSLQQDLLDRRQERDLKHAQAVETARYKSDLMNMIKVAVPLILDKVMKSGGKVNETLGNPPPEIQAVTALMNQLTPEETNGLVDWAKSLGPQKGMMFLEFYKGLAAHHQTQENSKPELLREKN